MEPSPKPPGPMERQTLPETQPGPLYGMGGSGPPTSMMRPSSCNIFARKQTAPLYVEAGRPAGTEEVHTKFLTNNLHVHTSG